MAGIICPNCQSPNDDSTLTCRNCNGSLSTLEAALVEKRDFQGYIILERLPKHDSQSGFAYLAHKKDAPGETLVIRDTKLSAVDKAELKKEVDAISQKTPESKRIAVREGHCFTVESLIEEAEFSERREGGIETFGPKLKEPVDEMAGPATPDKHSLGSGVPDVATSTIVQRPGQSSAAGGRKKTSTTGAVNEESGASSGTAKASATQAEGGAHQPGETTIRPQREGGAAYPKIRTTGPQGGARYEKSRSGKLLEVVPVELDFGKVKEGEQDSLHQPVMVNTTVGGLVAKCECEGDWLRVASLSRRPGEQSVIIEANTSKLTRGKHKGKVIFSVGRNGMHEAKVNANVLINQSFRGWTGHLFEHAIPHFVAHVVAYGFLALLGVILGVLVLWYKGVVKPNPPKIEEIFLLESLTPSTVHAGRNARLKATISYNNLRALKPLWTPEDLVETQEQGDGLLKTNKLDREQTFPVDIEVKLTVVDEFGRVHSLPKMVSVVNSPPTVEIRTASVSPVQRGDKVPLSVRVEDDCKEAELVREWIVYPPGEAVVRNEKGSEPVLDTIGTNPKPQGIDVAVRLQVTDSHGAIGMSNILPISVKARLVNKPAQVSLWADKTVVHEGEIVALKVKNVPNPIFPCEWTITGGTLSNKGNCMAELDTKGINVMHSFITVLVSVNQAGPHGLIPRGSAEIRVRPPLPPAPGAGSVKPAQE